MEKLTLIVGAGSTWSMRAWMSLTLANIPFKEIVIPLGSLDYKKIIEQYSETMLVPVLVSDHLKIHDSLAIAEYANELSHGALYPKDSQLRAQCRSLCAELHSGFLTIRNTCPYYPESNLTFVTSQALENEIGRVKLIWEKTQSEFYFGPPSLIDVYYSVLAHRLLNYGIEFEGAAGQYQKNVLSWSLFSDVMNKVKAWQAVKLN